MLIGEFEHNIDNKGRLTLPSKLRKEIGNDFYITRGLENCLFVYPKSEWDKLNSRLEKLPFTAKNNRTFLRFFLSGAIEGEFDSQGRVNITSPLIKHADLVKECIIVGVGDHVEIWSKDRWQEFYTTNFDEMSDIAEQLFLGQWEN